eukprot:222594-Chlamydomonas_euryale.AAC.3
MPPAQYALEKKIIESMHHKLSFLRNPRYPLPPAVKMLQTQFKPGARWNVPEPDGTRRAPPIKANMTARPDQVFVVEPEAVVFTNYGACWRGVEGVGGSNAGLGRPCTCIRQAGGQPSEPRRRGFRHPPTISHSHTLTLSHSSPPTNLTTIRRT